MSENPQEVIRKQFTAEFKAKAIRDMLKIRSFDTDWTLPSRMADNPTVWLIQVNGMIVDARAMLREIQEQAFQLGMIPYIPADHRSRSFIRR